jgi:hypothetical protein
MGTWNHDAPLSQALSLWSLMSALRWREVADMEPHTAVETLTLRKLSEWALHKTLVSDREDLRTFWPGTTWISPEWGWQRMGNGIALILSVTARLSVLVQPDGIIKVFQTRKVAGTENEIPWLVIAKDGEIAEHHFPSVISYWEERVLLAIMSNFTGQDEEDFYPLLPEVKPDYDPAVEPQG